MSSPPIAFAVMGGDLALVKSRFEAGADIDEMTAKGTALHVACIYQREEIGRYLLENGANPRAKNDIGQMPIDVADSAKLVALLREFGVEELGHWDMYSVFVLLCKFRALNFISKKRKLLLFFQQWNS